MNDTHTYSCLSPNLGIREKRLDKSTAKYSELTGQIKEIYRLYAPDFYVDNIYRHFLAFNVDKQVVEYSKEFPERLRILCEGYHKWEVPSVDASWGGWITVMISRNSTTHEASADSPGNIKVYAYIDSEDVPEIFMDSLRYLLENANSTFAAKISTFLREDMICYWLSPADFRCLESFYRPLSDKMTASMPFVAYLGKLGISKELFWPDISHNELQARIISDYLKTVNCSDDIDLELMYNNYIAKWNGDVEETSYAGFKNGSVLSFVTILDTLDGLLRGGLERDSLLLTDNSKLWNLFASSQCWADLGL